MNPNKLKVPAFVSAGDPRGLRRAMLLRQLELGAELKFYDIQFVDGGWYAWYDAIEAENLQVSDLLTDADRERPTT